MAAGAPAIAAIPGGPASGTWVELARIEPEVPEPAVRVGPGGLIGRATGAALRIDDPRVSEAHALVSRRGRHLRLLALRRWFELDGRRASEATLAAGQRIRLAPGVTLLVQDVRIADAALAVRIGRTAPMELEASVYSVVRRAGELSVEPGYAEAAEGRLWSTASGWRGQAGGEPAVDLEPGTVLRMGGEVVELVALPLGPGASTLDTAAIDPPLRIVLRHDTVHLFRDRRAPVVVGGVPARILTEVALIGGPAPWDVPAREIWRRTRRRDLLRRNWDRNNRTLRAKLAAADIRIDLVRADGQGNVELLLLPGDEVVDET